ncbi:MAG: hypothetical protein ABSB79_02045 [Syntrophales bacterium]|jgi:hypothetical protein
METKNGTKFIDGIKYDKYPPPVTLIKATEFKWAEKLLNEGSIRLNSIEYYETIENPELGDVNEGKGMLRLNGHLMQTGSVNEVFIWCSALPGTSASILKEIDPSYDTMICITDVVEFTKRIFSALKDYGYRWLPWRGQVTYNRDIEVSKKTLNNQDWQFNIFQKSAKHKHQREYRMSFTNVSVQRKKEKWIDISMGYSGDIMTIEK